VRIYITTQANITDHAAEEQKNVLAENNALTFKTQEIREQVAKENDELQEATDEIAKMERNRNKKDEHKASLQAQIEETIQAIERKRASKAPPLTSDIRCC
jgi:septal ring factor EnvC (AmiA/AmiB activator)